MKAILFILFMVLFSNLPAQRPIVLTVNPFTDFSYTDVEPNVAYNFDQPVFADILTTAPGNYVPSFNNRYFMSIFGPRHKSVATSNIGFFDFHKGADITANVDFNGTSFDEITPPNIHCVCDGEIYNIFTGPNPESTGTGIYVEVKCNDIFHANPAWSNVYTAYRHLTSVEPGLNVGDPVNKGDILGLMGSTGYTTTVHLHFSVIRRNTGTSINVQPRRIFSPTLTPHLISHLTTAEITQLSQSATEALFRIAIPHNQANIRAIEVNLTGTAYSKTYDFEAIGLLPETDRDDNDIVAGLELFAYPFNRGHSAYRRVWDRYEEGQIPAIYPASPDAGSGQFFPFLSEDLFQTPAYVLDLKVKDLPTGFNISDLSIKIIDIWGYGVEANGQNQPTNEHFSWSMIDVEENDAEEYETGTISLTSPDIDLVFDAGHGNQEVGLRFEGLQLPKDANITSAWVQFRADASGSDVTNLTFHAEDHSNAALFTTNSNNISNRTTTAAAVNWQPNAWTIDDMNADQKLGGLTNIVQELTNRNDWTSNSPIVLLISGTGKREAEGYAPTNLWKNAYLYIEYNDAIVLPINLDYFKGKALEISNLIEWQTNAEQNTAWMIVERSTRNGKNWVEIGRIAAKNTSNSVQYYHLEDQNPLADNYYRLKSVDIDGIFRFSETISVHRTNNKENNLHLFPNPASGKLNIDISEFNEKFINIRIMNSSGKIVQNYFLHPTTKQDLLQLDVHSLSQGIYFLLLNNEQFCFLKK